MLVYNCKIFLFWIWNPAHVSIHALNWLSCIYIAKTACQRENNHSKQVILVSKQEWISCFKQVLIIWRSSDWSQMLGLQSLRRGLGSQPGTDARFIGRKHRSWPPDQGQWQGPGLRLCRKFSQEWESSETGVVFIKRKKSTDRHVGSSRRESLVHCPYWWFELLSWVISSRLTLASHLIYLVHHPYLVYLRILRVCPRVS